MAARLQQLPDPAAAAARAIATVDLEAAADRATGGYSKGMRQRVKIASALVHDPSILLLDEPFNGMDPRQRLHMMDLLRSMAAAGRTILFSSHILEEVERIADGVLVIVAGRLAAAGDFRDPSPDDRPAAHVRRPVVRRSPPRRGVHDRTGGLRHGAPRRPPPGPGPGVRRLHPERGPRRPRRIGVAARGLPDRRLARERLRLPGVAPMTIFATLASVTLRALLGRRRTLLMVLLAAMPVLLGLLVRANEDELRAEVLGPTIDGLVIRVVLPLIALVFGTAALGMELEDGTGVHLLTKPVERWQIIVVKTLVAGTLTAVLIVPSTVVSGLLMGGFTSAAIDVTFAFALANIVGSYLYTAIFLVLSVITTRGLIIGLAYALIWEAVVAGPAGEPDLQRPRVPGRDRSDALAWRRSRSRSSAPVAIYAAVAIVLALVIGRSASRATRSAARNRDGINVAVAPGRRWTSAGRCAPRDLRPMASAELRLGLRWAGR